MRVFLDAKDSAAFPPGDPGGAPPPPERSNRSTTFELVSFLLTESLPFSLPFDSFLSYHCVNVIVDKFVRSRTEGADFVIWWSLALHPSSIFSSPERLELVKCVFFLPLPGDGQEGIDPSFSCIRGAVQSFFPARWSPPDLFSFSHSWLINPLFSGRYNSKQVTLFPGPLLTPLPVGAECLCRGSS